MDELTRGRISTHKKLEEIKVYSIQFFIFKNLTKLKLKYIFI